MPRSAYRYIDQTARRNRQSRARSMKPAFFDLPPRDYRPAFARIEAEPRPTATTVQQRRSPCSLTRPPSARLRPCWSPSPSRSGPAPLPGQLDLSQPLDARERFTHGIIHARHIDTAWPIQPARPRPGRSNYDGESTPPGSIGRTGHPAPSWPEFLLINKPPLGKVRVEGWLPRNFPCVRRQPSIVYVRGGHLARFTRLADGSAHTSAERYLYRAHDLD